VGDADDAGAPTVGAFGSTPTASGVEDVCAYWGLPSATRITLTAQSAESSARR
jgi:hypothetical protein